MENSIPDKKEEFIGLSKKEIIQKMGEGFNFYPDKEWSYVLKKYWYGKTKILFLEFDHNDIVTGQYTISKF
ncbi:hypothetical protein [Chryseobacterium indologenes]|uniref:Uncharacterized protein n=1 Tax=Chryseobacterium indologenes TaxID=253 RepID=A0A0N0ZWH7_CHRID|nr:hypothetical protein [Chryseobacterium indologenes]KPE52838.1 hypothetical protein AOB46_02245 [Chryseobacterium indologenes]